jgi:DNA helicase-2/ATP-dependent DNA helicase PcrA
MTNENHPLLRLLNAQQRAAIVAPDVPILVLAGPGSGKTRVLTHRIAWLLSERQVPAWQVLAVTFTNKAAREMLQRLNEMLGDTTAREMTLGTFHATCARILRREADAARISRDYLIFDSDDQLSVMKQVVKDIGVDEKRYRPRSLLNAVSSAKNELVPPTEYPIQTYYDEIVARAYEHYQNTLRQNDGLDFDDLLMKTATLFQDDSMVLEKYRRRYRHMLVDEFQDTNMAQYVILKLLAQEHRHLYVVADEDQSIYSWRGADYRNILRLREDFPELEQYLLEENYRSTQVILNAAKAVIAPNPDRTPKELFTRKREGAPITLHEAYDERREAEFVAQEVNKLRREGFAYSDIAVMYRTNAQSRALEEALVSYNIPYRLIGATRFYARKEIKDVLAFLRLVQNPDDDVSFMRVVNVPPRGIGTRTLARVSAEANELGVSRYQGLMSLVENQSVSTRAYNVLRAFATMLGGWLEIRDEASLPTLFHRILDDTGYRDYLRDGSEEGESRWENVQSLEAVIEEEAGSSLTDFLTEVALVADVDRLAEEVQAITLLTLHSAKGLEYPIVFITGLEEGLLPHSRSMDTPEELAEERRLMYVGMTRAEVRLYLTYAFTRKWGRYYGDSSPSDVSRFLEDVPDEVLSRPRRAQRQPKSHDWSVGGWGTKRQRRSKPRREATTPLQYQNGQRVHHRHYGEGVVIDSERDGRNEMVTVLFANGVGVKRLLAGMAPMEPLSDH